MADLTKAEIREIIEAQEKEQAFLRSQVAVTLDDYSKAVVHLVGLARCDTSGGRIAAQVLLSIYNGDSWHVNLVELGLLDYDYIYSALVAIRGRLTVHEEPHNIIKDGSAIFADLEVQWQHLHTNKRYEN
jgi:hypothetical protein